jgi:ankyrin repeat protein
MHAAAAGGDTAAHEAAVRALAAAGADPSVADREGRTPLHSAAAAGHAACVAALLGVGAVAGPRDKNSQTAADLALLRGHKRLAGTLIAAAR